MSLGHGRWISSLKSTLILGSAFKLAGLTAGGCMLASVALAVESKPQECAFLARRYQHVVKTFGTESPPSRRELSRLRADYVKAGCEGRIDDNRRR